MVTMSAKPSVYLAGPIQHASDSGHGWRDALIEQYGDRFRFLNPLDKYDADAVTVIYPWDEPDEETSAEQVTTREIVAGDKSLIQHADAILIAYLDATAAWGTPQEQLFVHERGIPNVFVWGDFAPSPWAIEHASFYTQDMGEAIDWLDATLTIPRHE